MVYVLLGLISEMRMNEFSSSAPIDRNIIECQASKFCATIWIVCKGRSVGSGRGGQEMVIVLLIGVIFLDRLLIAQ